MRIITNTSSFCAKPQFGVFIAKNKDSGAQFENSLIILRNLVNIKMLGLTNIFTVIIIVIQGEGKEKSIISFGIMHLTNRYKLID